MRQGRILVSCLLIIGGCSMMVNLVVFSLVYYRVSWPANQQWHYALAFVAASEVSILANFFPNDAITFRRLPGHSRPWPVRCLRFHATYLLGTLLQLLLSFSLHLLGCPAVLAQALAIALVTAFNFAFHHIFTYRGKRKHHTALLDHASKSSKALRSMNSREGE